ncbi:MAG: hypothetical protein ICV87_02480 [Gemmatimonadetes bacterium]|nr:hypothetical protein [Gemmatimonadota bacterium]
MIQSFEERYEDVLQNIESAIVGIYRSDPALVDYEVDGCLESLIASYTAEIQGRPPRDAPSDPNRRRVFEAVREVCEWRLGRADLQGFGATGPLNTMDEIVACLKRVRKSAQRWTKRAGRQGYLSFVSKYVF